MSETLAKRRVKTSSLTVIISLALVLFMLGLLGLVVLNAQKLSNHIKENIGFQVILKDTTTAAQIDILQQEISVSAFAKSVTHITKEQAAEKLKEDLGEDFISFLGYNPLLSSLDVKLNADYATWLAFQIGPSGTTQQYLNRILIYINKAFAVEPENKNALQALSMVENYAPDLTYTPPATIQATITPIPSITPTPTISPTATDTLFLTWTDTATPTRKPTKTSTSSPMPSPTPQFSESAHGYSKVTFWLALFAVILLAGAGYFYWRPNGKRSRQ